MGIEVEFSPELALHRFGAEERHEDECLPMAPAEGVEYEFIESGHRNYHAGRDVSLIEAGGDRDLASPLAQVRVTSFTHLRRGDELLTKGQYRINKLLDFYQ